MSNLWMDAKIKDLETGTSSHVSSYFLCARCVIHLTSHLCSIFILGLPPTYSIELHTRGNCNYSPVRGQLKGNAQNVILHRPQLPVGYLDKPQVKPLMSGVYLDKPQRFQYMHFCISNPSKVIKICIFYKTVKSITIVILGL